MSARFRSLRRRGALTHASAQGLVLVTEAGKHKAEGVIFGLGLQNFLGRRTDTFAFVPFKVQN